MENLHFLSKISNLLISEIDTKELADGIKQLLQQIVPVKRLQIFVFDNVTNTMRDSSNNWSVIPDESEIYKIYENLKDEDFVINSKAYKLPALNGGICLINDPENPTAVGGYSRLLGLLSEELT